MCVRVYVRAVCACVLCVCVCVYVCAVCVCVCGIGGMIAMGQCKDFARYNISRCQLSKNGLSNISEK